MSNRTQNYIISALATYVRGEILKEMDESKTFSILLDETTVVSHVEQMSFVVHMSIKWNSKIDFYKEDVVMTLL